MTTTEQPPAVDMEKLMGFALKAVGEFGATLTRSTAIHLPAGARRAA